MAALSPFSQANMYFTSRRIWCKETLKNKYNLLANHSMRQMLINQLQLSVSANEQRFYLYPRADRELGKSLLINLYPGLLTVKPPRLCKYFCGLTWRLLGFSMFLIHLFAWPCGSIIRGQRCELVTIIALSSEKLKVKP